MGYSGPRPIAGCPTTPQQGANSNPLRFPCVNRQPILDLDVPANGAMRNPTSVAIISVAFGPLPENIEAVFESMADNPAIDFLVFSDTDHDDLPSGTPTNCYFMYLSRQMLNSLMAETLGRSVAFLPKQALVDLQHTYGHVFESFLRPYGFWGYSELGTVCSPLLECLTEQVLTDHDVFRVDQCIMRNTASLSTLYKQIPGFWNVVSSRRKQQDREPDRLNDTMSRLLDELRDRGHIRIWGPDMKDPGSVAPSSARRN